jgi:hypothetical protein
MRIKIGNGDSRRNIDVCFGKRKLIGPRMGAGEIDSNSEVVGI